MQISYSEKEKAELEAKNASLAAELAKREGPVNPFDDTIAKPDDDLEYFQSNYPNIFKGAIALVRKEISRVEQKVDTVGSAAEKASRAVYFENLGKEITNWEEINNSKEFRDWLQQSPRYMTVPKHNLLMDAFNRKDVATTAQFFKDFLDDSQGKFSTDESASRNKSRDISPNTSGSPSPSQSGGKGIVTREDINRFYKDRAEGRFVGSEEDAAKIESRFLRAVREGKVR